MINKSHPRILAIDPGARHIGIAVLQGSDLVYHGVVTTPHRRSSEAVRRNTRILLRELLRDFRPRVLAVEETHSFGDARTSSLLHAVASETRRIGRREQLRVVTKTAASVKKFVTGNGRASKEEIARVCAHSFPELTTYLRQVTKWRKSCHGNMFAAVALALTTAEFVG